MVNTSEPTIDFQETFVSFPGNKLLFPMFPRPNASKKPQAKQAALQLQNNVSSEAGGGQFAPENRPFYPIGK